ncbi:RHS repeat-associated core domain-containing protein [Microbulbifer taiwanensis]|uniref:RHS repeat-associated core domain-containing protein n=1 Tax=Microbulbifer taiwanensis TaxID=986746 RepID=UPI001D02060C|nr:RHS repeat-associated core domain-containing protein [Microbulbifer taiwanensis]
MSYVRESRTPAGRLPLESGDVPLNLHVSINGAAIDFVPASLDASRYVARDRSLGSELLREGPDLWVLRHGIMEYRFERIAGTNPDTYYLVRIDHAVSFNRWLLAGIPMEYERKSDSRVVLGYDVASQEGSVEIRLNQLRYNHLPGSEQTSCPASVVDLVYRQPSELGLDSESGPIADGVLDVRTAASAGDSYKSTVVTRVLERIDLLSRSQGCAVPLVSQAQLVLDYDVDPDLKQPRLRGVDRHGREGEAGAPLPLARYDYADFTDGGGALAYDPDEQWMDPAVLPADMKPSFSDVEYVTVPAVGQQVTTADGVSPELPEDTDITRAYWSYSVEETHSTTPPGLRHRFSFPAATLEKSWTAFVDLTGDGLPDLVYRSTDDGELKLARNRSTDSSLDFEESVNLFSEGNFDMSEVGGGKLPLNLRYTTDVAESDGLATSSVDYVRLQDLNGDGRLDLVDARTPGEWVAYINTPPSHRQDTSPEFGPSGDYPIYWMKTRIPVDHLVEEWREKVRLDESNLTIDNGWISGDRFPLSWTLSGMELAQARAFDYFGWNLGNFCTDLDVLDPLSMPLASCAWERNTAADITWSLDQKSDSYVVIDTRDINGDSYPDLVSIDWPQGFQFVGGWTPKSLQKSIPDAECRALGLFGQDCEPDVFSASAEPPWEHYRSSVAPVVLPKPQGDSTLIEQQMSQSHSRFLDCYSDGAVECTGFQLSAYGDCYSWYGGRRRDLKPTDGYNCYVEDLSVRWQGFTRGINTPPKRALNVHYNVAGARLGPQSITGGRLFAQSRAPLVNSIGACGGVQRWTSDGEEGVNERRTLRVCGLVEANGDGFPDLLHSSGGAQLGTGDGFLDQRVHAQAGRTEQLARLPVCNASGRRHPHHLNDPAQTPSPQNPSIVSYANWMDRNGDGLPDSASRLGTGGRVMVNYHVAEKSSKGTFDSDAGCDDSARVQEMLVDVTGSGLPDRARIVGSELRIRKPVIIGTGGSVEDRGLWNAGKLIRVTDGFGAGMEYRYTNAKRDPWGKHQVPFAEIVLEWSRPIGGLGAPGEKLQEPTYYAYGDNAMRYDTYTERFVPTGYLYTAEVRGKTQTSGTQLGQVKGKGQVVIRRNNSFDPITRDWLVGTRDQVRSYEGYFFSARDLLMQYMTGSFDGDVYYTGNNDNTIEAYLYPPSWDDLPPEHYDNGRCERLDFPYGGIGQAETPVASRTCADQGILVVRSEREFEASAYLARDHSESFHIVDPYLRNVKRQTLVEEWDDRGRPLRVKNQGDYRDAEDDFCTHYEYAQSNHDQWKDKEFQPLNLLAKLTVDDCSGKVEREKTFYYEGSEQEVAGEYRLFPYVETIETRFRTHNGTIPSSPTYLRSVNEGAVEYRNVYGQALRVTTRNHNPISTKSVVRTTEIDYDNFQMVPVRRSVRASDVSNFAKREAMNYETGSYRLASLTDLNTNVSTLFGYDRYGRRTTTAISSPGHSGGAPQIISAIEYLGEDSPDHAGRKLRLRRFEKWYPLEDYAQGTAVDGELWTEQRFDIFGRLARIDKYLGEDPDYGDARLAVWSAEYDGQGRVSHINHPFVVGEKEDELVSTYHHADLSSDPFCVVTAPGVQKSPPLVEKVIEKETIEIGTPSTSYVFPVTDGGRELISHCSLMTFQMGQRKKISISPYSLASDDPQDISMEVSIYGATGQLAERRSWLSGKDNARDLMRLDYDQFGNLQYVSRYRDTEELNFPGQALTWQYEHDGLGRTTLFASDGIEPIHFRYDEWGNMNKVGQASVNAELGVSWKGYEHDGFGRLKRWELLTDDGLFRLTPNIWGARYSYIGDGQTGAGHLRAIERSQSPIVEFEYDAFGRRSMTRHSMGASLISEVEWEYDGLSRIGGQKRRSSATDMAEELINFRYDSAGRVRAAEYNFGLISSTLKNIVTMDPWGRPLKSVLGNSSVREFQYGTSGHRRLEYVYETLPGVAAGDGPIRRIHFGNYLGRLKSVTSERVESKLALTAVASGSIHQGYWYNDLNQLIGFKQKDTLNNSWTHDYEYAYDSLGNLQDTVDHSQDSSVYTRFIPRQDDMDKICRYEIGFESGPEQSTVSNELCTFEYDRRGNLVKYRDPLSNAERQLWYNDLNEITKIKLTLNEQISYRYAGDGSVSERRDHALGETMFQLGSVGQRRGGENGESVIWESTLPSGASLRGTTEASELYYAGFQTNSANTTLDDAGLESSFSSYSPYGKPTERIEPGHTAVNQRRWHGTDVCNPLPASGGCRMYDKLYRMGPRVYDAEIGRFLQRDPLAIPRSAIKANPYHYAWNNPIVFNDSSGLDPVTQNVKVLEPSDNPGGMAMGTALLDFDYVGFPLARGNYKVLGFEYSVTGFSGTVFSADTRTGNRYGVGVGASVLNGQLDSGGIGFEPLKLGFTSKYAPDDVGMESEVGIGVQASNLAKGQLPFGPIVNLKCVPGSGPECQQRIMNIQTTAYTNGDMLHTPGVAVVPSSAFVNGLLHLEPRPVDLQGGESLAYDPTVSRMDRRTGRSNIESVPGDGGDIGLPPVGYFADQSGNLLPLGGFSGFGGGFGWDSSYSFSRPALPSAGGGQLGRYGGGLLTTLRAAVGLVGGGTSSESRYRTSVEVKP